MATNWQKLDEGIRARVHPTRKHGIKPDMYFVLRFSADGQRKQEALGWASEGWTLAKARAELAKLKEAARTGVGEITLQERRAKAKAERQAEQNRQEIERLLAVTLQQYWTNNYFSHCKRTKAAETWRKEESNFKTWLAPTLGDIPLRKLSKYHFDAIDQRMGEEGLAKRTTQLVFATMRAIWNHARANKLVTGDCPTQEIKLGKINNARNRTLSATEAQELLSAIKLLDENAWAFTLACLHTGGRLGEVSRLTWGHVNMTERYITLVHTKTGKPRAVPLTATLFALLQAMPKGNMLDLVFTNSSGMQWIAMPTNFRKALCTLKLNEGVTDRKERLVFHSLRHSAASMLLDAGEDIRTIQEIFGWSTLAMLQRYTHPTAQKKQRAMGSLDTKLKQ